MNKCFASFAVRLDYQPPGVGLENGPSHHVNLPVNLCCRKKDERVNIFCVQYTTLIDETLHPDQWLVGNREESNFRDFHDDLFYYEIARNDFARCRKTPRLL